MRYRRSKNYKTCLDVFKETIVIGLEVAKNKTWQEIFGNERPTYLEIGMGKGQFLRRIAMANPHSNYVGVEKLEPLLLGNCKQINLEKIDNIRLFALNANYLEEYFEPKSIDGIYLNFSDPWPKNKNANKRLTHKNMLKRYRTILKDGGFIEFKTDNKPLFDFSVKEMTTFGFEQKGLPSEVNYIENDNIRFTTEYEDKFRNLGKEIFFVKYLVKPLENIVN